MTTDFIMTKDFKQLLSEVENECDRTVRERGGSQDLADLAPKGWAALLEHKADRAVNGLALHYRRRLIELASTALLAVLSWDTQNAKPEQSLGVPDPLAPVKEGDNMAGHWQEGYVQALRDYAVWQNGVQVVGCGVTTLAEAAARVPGVVDMARAAEVTKAGNQSIAGRAALSRQAKMRERLGRLGIC